jgi:c-di-GMP-related signal transduction protein
VVAAAAGTSCRPLAAGVREEAHHARALALGFSLLEGRFPHLLAVGAQGEISSPCTTILRLLALLANDDCPDGVLVDALRADPGVSYKLLRLVNSTGDEGLRESLEFAVRVMGRSSLKRWLSILLVRAQERASPLKDELIFSSLVRARFGELVRAGPRTGLLRPLPDASGAFLPGLFSRLEELLGRPFAESLGGLRLHPDALLALVEEKGPAVGLLRVMKLAESGGCDELVPLMEAEGTEPEWLGDCWIEATHWAHEKTAGS